MKTYIIYGMIPYPSGSIHVGHLRNYSLVDILGRFWSLLDYNIIYPMGWDSFGTPAENAANIYNIHPKIWIKFNILNMKKQIKSMNLNINWNLEFSTSDNKYKFYQQKIFCYLYKIGFIERSKKIINWDPLDKTVLSNEQVIFGYGWRSNVKIVKKILLQWFIKVSNLSKILLKDLNYLNFWPKKVLCMQRKWISIYFKFYLKFKIYFCKKLLINISFTLISLINYRVYSKFHNLLINPLYCRCVLKYNYRFVKNIFNFNIIWSLKYKFIFNYKIFNWKKKNKLKNWCLSRQRYWGCSIPIFICNNCGFDLINELPIKLPIKFYFKFKNLLYKHPTWKYIVCFKCKGLAKLDCNTMDTFFDSSNYFYNVQLNLKYKGPVYFYVGGIEHAILHLLYLRCITKIFYGIRLIKFSEPVYKLLAQGMILYPIIKLNNNWIKPLNSIKYKINSFNLVLVIYKNSLLVKLGPYEKISKSKKNIIEIEFIRNYYSSDSIKLFVMSNYPVDYNIKWNNQYLKFFDILLLNILNLCFKIKNSKCIYSKVLNIEFVDKIIKFYIKYNTFKLNVIISYIHILYNNINKIWYRSKVNIYIYIYIILYILYPISPSCSDICMNILNFKKISYNKFLTWLISYHKLYIYLYIGNKRILSLSININILLINNKILLLILTITSIIKIRHLRYFINKSINFKD